MDGLNHLREQSADTFIDKILEEMYSLLIIQIQSELLLKLIDQWITETGKSMSVVFTECSHALLSHDCQLTLRPPLSSEEISGMPDLSINLKRFSMRLLDFLRMLYASQQYDLNLV
jgi:hypothetical protein